MEPVNPIQSDNQPSPIVQPAPVTPNNIFPTTSSQPVSMPIAMPVTESANTPGSLLLQWFT